MSYVLHHLRQITTRVRAASAADKIIISEYDLRCEKRMNQTESVDETRDKICHGFQKSGDKFCDETRKENFTI